MTNVKFKSGVAVKGNNEPINSISEALKEQANCSPCGCDDCLGFWTQTNATTGELMMVYITGTNPYTLVIKPFDEGLTLVKALYKARS